VLYFYNIFHSNELTFPMSCDFFPLALEKNKDNAEDIENFQMQIKNAYYDKFEFKVTSAGDGYIKLEKGIATKVSEGYYEHSVSAEDGSITKMIGFTFNTDGSITFIPHTTFDFTSPVTFVKDQGQQENFKSGEEDTEKEVKISPEEVLELLIKSRTTQDTRPDKGYSYDGIDIETGYYMFSWCNPGKGTGASYKVDPYTGDVYNMGKKTANLLESTKENNVSVR